MVIPEVVRVKTLVAKATGVAFSVIGGLAVGKVSNLTLKLLIRHGGNPHMF